MHFEFHHGPDKAEDGRKTTEAVPVERQSLFELQIIPDKQMLSKPRNVRGMCKFYNLILEVQQRTHRSLRASSTNLKTRYISWQIHLHRDLPYAVTV